MMGSFLLEDTSPATTLDMLWRTLPRPRLDAVFNSALNNVVSTREEDSDTYGGRFFRDHGRLGDMVISSAHRDAAGFVRLHV